jgi:membrane protease YdiL (CAAX protease family)
MPERISYGRERKQLSAWHLPAATAGWNGMSGAHPRALRLAAALALACAGVLLASPVGLVPWGERVHALLPGRPWPLLPALVSVVLLASAALMPHVQRARPQGAITDYTAMAVGLLLLAEPLVHLLVLGWNAWHPSLASVESVLPSAGALSDAGGWSGAARLLSVTLLAPVAEEAFFRGRLLPWLDDAWAGARWGRPGAMLLSSLAFAVAHGDPVLVVFGLPLGLLLAHVRLRSGSLGACMLAHACHNSLFLFVGPGLISTPWMAPVLSTGGAVLVSVAWLHHRRPRSRHRHLHAVAVMLSVLSVIVLTYPFYRQLQDALWVRAAHRLVVSWRVANDVLLERLDEQRRHGRLDAGRRAALFTTLEAEPCPRLPGGNPRQTLVLAVLDAERLAGRTDAAQAYDRLLDLVEARPRPALGAAARALGLGHPEDLVAVLVIHPEVVPSWLPLHQDADACLAQLEATSGHRRRMLLSALEHAFPGSVAGLLLRLPAGQITPLDRRHLFGSYPEARDLIDRLDAERKAAWLAPGEP